MIIHLISQILCLISRCQSMNISVYIHGCCYSFSKLVGLDLILCAVRNIVTTLSLSFVASQLRLQFFYLPGRFISIHGQLYFKIKMATFSSLAGYFSPMICSSRKIAFFFSSLSVVWVVIYMLLQQVMF